MGKEHKVAKADRQPRHRELEDAVRALRGAVHGLGGLRSDISGVPQAAPEQTGEADKPLSEVLVEVPTEIAELSEDVMRLTAEIRDLIL